MTLERFYDDEGGQNFFSFLPLKNWGLFRIKLIAIEVKCADIIQNFTSPVSDNVKKEKITPYIAFLNKHRPNWLKSLTSQERERIEKYNPETLKKVDEYQIKVNKTLKR